MCNPGWGRGVVWLCVALAPGNGLAQTASAWRDSTQRLFRELHTVRDSLLQGDSTVRELGRHGDVVIRASGGFGAVATPAFERFIEVRSRWFGGATPSSDGFRIVLGSSLSGDPATGELDNSTIILVGQPDTGLAPHVRRLVARRDVGNTLIDLFGEMMFQSGGASLTKWLDLYPPLSMPEQDRRHLAMYALVTGTGHAQRGCAIGRLPDCSYALGLSPPGIEEPGGAYAPIVRVDLLLTALELGGSGAWFRFRTANTGSMEAALSAAAGVTPESLLAQWRRGLLDLRTRGGPVELHRALLAVAWTSLLLLGTLAGGLSRWR